MLPIKLLIVIDQRMTFSGFTSSGKTPSISMGGKPTANQLGWVDHFTNGNQSSIFLSKSQCSRECLFCGRLQEPRFSGIIFQRFSAAAQRKPPITGRVSGGG